MKSTIKWRWSLLLVTAAVMIMQLQGKSLKTVHSPKGIIDLEFASTAPQLNACLGYWNLNSLRLNIGLDFMFIVAYTFFFVISLRLIREKTVSPFWHNSIKTGITAAYLAALFDVVENTLMLFSLSGNYSETSLLFTTLFAKSKFLLVALILFILLCGLPAIRFNRKPTFGQNKH